MATNKKKNKPPPRAMLLEDFISRHKQHLLRLEQTLRLVDNLVIEPTELENVKEWVDDYVDRCEDSPEDFADVDSCYEDIMEQLETAVEVREVLRVLLGLFVEAGVGLCMKVVAAGDVLQCMGCVW